MQYAGTAMMSLIPTQLLLHKIYNSISIPGGGALNFFGGYVPLSFSKSRVKGAGFLEKLEVLGAKIQKFCFLRAENFAKTKLKMQFFLKFENEGTSDALMGNW